MTAGCRSYVEKYDIPQLRCVRVAADIPVAQMKQGLLFVCDSL